MGLFDQILGAIDNPNQQASPNQLSSILNVVQQVSGQQGMNSSATQAVLSVLGSHVRSALQQQQANGGRSQVASIIEQFAGTSPNQSAVQSIFSPQQQQSAVQDAAQRTGIDARTIQMLLPILIPVVLNLLKTGASNQGSVQNPQSNSVLNAFLDADNDGAVDVGDAISIAGRFLSQR
ncbi:hypothetical protein H6F67_03930 [Microcoleus sp. FACHB-1515]|uniref:hypothetical protein n=1 Tax=Cyanophyceae TaxID=3028117 RepID=UPI0016871C39|nr:hypothetical protein [Microcoleus sp. FACHB-1515]MBD2089002.1 hypothetical protein [Microcoleus sp. FACHB-1515]